MSNYLDVQNRQQQVVPAPQRQVGPVPQGTNGFAIASLVLSLIGVSGLGIIFGAIGRSQTGRTGQSGRTMATWGLWLGIIGMIAWIIWIVVIVVAAAHAGTTTYGTY
jgi:hypothetical protein